MRALNLLHIIQFDTQQRLGNEGARIKGMNIHASYCPIIPCSAIAKGLPIPIHLLNKWQINGELILALCIMRNDIIVRRHGPSLSGQQTPEI